MIMPWICWLGSLFLTWTPQAALASHMDSFPSVSAHCLAANTSHVLYAWQSVVSHPTDAKSYRHLVLENELDVLLVHDADTEYASDDCSLSLCIIPTNLPISLFVCLFISLSDCLLVSLTRLVRH